MSKSAIENANNPAELAAAMGQHYRELAISIIDQHIPSLTDEDEKAIDAALLELLREDGTNADLAIRTCACGAKIDGFYEYVSHLKEVLK